MHAERDAQKTTVLLTGASTGLGLAVAKKLVATNHQLILTAREASLPRFGMEGITESDRVSIRALDVTSAPERQRVIDEASARWGGVDVLINNAGVAYRAVVEHFSDEGRWDQMNINFRAPMELIRLVLPGMRAKRAGRIINVSSVGGMMAMPTMALYSASKFALEGATEALWYEVRPWNIHVSLVQPGFIHSDSFLKTRYTEASRRGMEDPANPYFTHYDAMARMIAKLMNRTKHTPDDVAAVIFKTIHQHHPPLRVAGTWDANLFGMLRRIVPRRLYHRVLYKRLPEVKIWGGSCEVPGVTETDGR